MEALTSLFPNLATVIPPSSGQYVIWVIRAVLPIIFFFVWFRLQSPKGSWWPGPTAHKHPRELLLAVRKVVQEEAVPNSLLTLRLVDETANPSLFGGARARGGNSAKAAVDKRDKKLPREKKRQSSAEDICSESQEVLISDEERMYIESLLNYIAFNRKEQKRVFLPDATCTPPPPPLKVQPPTEPIEAGSPEAMKANLEAQMVLHGVLSAKLGIKRSDVAKDLHRQISDSNVEISERTFSLMVEVCIHAEDLKGASDFLLKMESAGHCPDSDLLDKVMDLYSRRKTEKANDAKDTSDEAPAGVSTSPLASPSDPLFSAQAKAAATEEESGDQVDEAAEAEEWATEKERPKRAKDRAGEKKDGPHPKSPGKSSHPATTTPCNFGAFFDDEDD